MTSQVSERLMVVVCCHLEITTRIARPCRTLERQRCKMISVLDKVLDALRATTANGLNDVVQLFSLSPLLLGRRLVETLTMLTSQLN